MGYLKKIIALVFLSTFVLICNVSSGEDMSIYEKLMQSQENKLWKVASFSGFNIDLYSFQTKEDKTVLKYGPEEGCQIGNALISPDYSKIVFSLSRHNSIVINVLNLDDSHIKELLKVYSLGDINSICWSPDMKCIVFIGKMERKNEEDFDEKKPSTWVSKYNSLYLYNIEKNTAKLLIDGGVRAISEQCWSPDSSKIIYEDINSNLYLYDIGKSNNKLFVQQASDATWSPKENWIAYKEVRPNSIRGDFFIIDSDKSKKIKILSANQNVWQKLRLIRSVMGAVIWSPDGKFLYYCRDTGLVLDVERPTPFIMEISTKKEERI
jgi:Tol biopolymer transport system component